MKVFVVSLKRSVERRENIQKQLDNIGIKFEFIDAVDAAHSDFKHSQRRAPKITEKRFGYQLVESEIACFASHFTVWEKCVAMNESILVLEDNFILATETSQNFNKLKSLADKYLFLKLCATAKKKYQVIESFASGLQVVRYKRRTCGTMGYLLSPQAARAFINHAQKFIEPVDDYMEKPWKHGVSTYCLAPDLVLRADIQSTIGSSRKDKSQLKTYKKVYIELFRLYEQIREKLKRHPY